MWMVNSDLSDALRTECLARVDQFAEALATHLAAAGLNQFTSPFSRPFSIALVRDAEKLLVGIAPARSTPQQWLLDRPQERFDERAMAQFLVEQQGQEVHLIAALPRPEVGDALARARTDAAARAQAGVIGQQQRLASLGNLAGREHLRSHLERFLADHPAFERNVFVMMPFREDAQMTEVWSALRTSLTAAGMHPVRADDRDYTGELFSNIEVYMTASSYGVAVFEQIEARDYNPNVALELGWMMGQGKRTLILKEQRLPNLPADVIHRLYRPWDSYNITESITREVTRWASIDLGITP